MLLKAQSIMSISSMEDANMNSSSVLGDELNRFMTASEMLCSNSCSDKIRIPVKFAYILRASYQS